MPNHFNWSKFVLFLLFRPAGSDLKTNVFSQKNYYKDNSYIKISCISFPRDNIIFAFLSTKNRFLFFIDILCVRLLIYSNNFGCIKPNINWKNDRRRQFSNLDNYACAKCSPITRLPKTVGQKIWLEYNFFDTHTHTITNRWKHNIYIYFFKKLFNRFIL